MKNRLMLIICTLTISTLLYAGEDPDFGFVLIEIESEGNMTASSSGGMTVVNQNSTIRYNPARKMTSDVIVYENYLDCPDMIKTQDINEKNSFGDTALHRAIEGDKVDEIRRLLQNGARYDIPSDLSNKTALSLMMGKSSDESRKCFAEHGIFVIPHADLCNNSFFSLLENGGKTFNHLLLESIGSDNVNNMIETLRLVFKKAWAHESCRVQGTIVTSEDATGLAKVKISELHQWFGKAVVSYTEDMIATYQRAQRFIDCCTDKNYTEAKNIRSEFPLLSKILCFNKYIMSKLLIKKEDDCWEFLLKDAKFEPNILSQLYGTILHGAAYALNPAALYYLVYFGANYKATNAKGKNPVEILIDGLKGQYKETAETCLCVVRKALKDRMQLVQDCSEYAEADKEIHFSSLMNMEDFIRRAMEGTKVSKNVITQLY